MAGQEFTVKPRTPKKRKVHWHLLMIGNNGKVFNFLRYKIFALLIVVLIFITTSSAIGMFFLFKNTHRENKILKESLDEFEKVAANFRTENEMLTARLVMAGIEPNSEVKKQINNPVGCEPEVLKPIEIEILSSQEQNNEDKNAAGEDINEEKVNNTEESFLKKDSKKSNIIAVTDLVVKQESKNNRLNVKFKLTNISRQTISGYVFVVLKDYQKPSDTWLTLPEKFLDSDGIPSNYKSGHKFKISRFKIVKFIPQHNENPGRSFKADVFVFGNNGDLLFKKEFPVEI